MVDGVNGWKFQRGLNDDFMCKLKKVAEVPGWFADVLGDEHLILGIRNNYLDVYYRGQRLFHVTDEKGRLRVRTHPKYLVDPTMEGEIDLFEHKFDWGVRDPVARTYGADTLNKMKRAAAYYSPEEKKGTYRIIRGNQNVLDVEIAFGKQSPQGTIGTEKQPSQIDIACLEMVNSQIRLHFWEAKRYANRELFASVGDAKVVDQIKSYRQYLKLHRPEVVESYKAVARNLVEISGWAHADREIGDLVREVGKNGCLYMEEAPVVGLAVFDYDDAQQKGDRFKTMKARLQAKIQPVVCKGDPRGLNLVAGSLPPAF
jgi:hypothetical protein